MLAGLDTFGMWASCRISKYFFVVRIGGTVVIPKNTQRDFQHPVANRVGIQLNC